MPDYTFGNKPAYSRGTWNEEVGYGLLNIYSTLNDALQISSSISLEGPENITNMRSSLFVRGVPSWGYVEWNVTENFKVSQSGYNSAYVWATKSGVKGGVTAIVRTRSGSIIANLSKQIFSLY